MVLFLYKNCNYHISLFYVILEMGVINIQVKFLVISYLE